MFVCNWVAIVSHMRKSSNVGNIQQYIPNTLLVDGFWNESQGGHGWTPLATDTRSGSSNIDTSWALAGHWQTEPCRIDG